MLVAPAFYYLVGVDGADSVTQFLSIFLDTKCGDYYFAQLLGVFAQQDVEFGFPPFRSLISRVA